MGGINCGKSNNRTVVTNEYRLNYAKYTKNYFKGLELFFSANVSVEDFTILEIENTNNAVKAYKKAIKLLAKAKNAFVIAKNSLKDCYECLEPLYKYNRIKEGSIASYRNLDQDKYYKLLHDNALIQDENVIYKNVYKLLCEGGEVSYLEYQINELGTLIDIIENLKLEYSKIENKVRSGMSYVSIRDIEVDVTPYTAKALTKINDISNSLVHLCLFEFTAHTSISGKKVELLDLIPNKQVEDKKNVV